VKFIEFIWPEAQYGREKYYFVGVIIKRNNIKNYLKRLLLRLLLKIYY